MERNNILYNESVAPIHMGVIGGGGKGSEVKKVYFLLFTSCVSQKHLGQ